MTLFNQRLKSLKYSNRKEDISTFKIIKSAMDKKHIEKYSKMNLKSLDLLPFFISVPK